MCLETPSSRININHGSSARRPRTRPLKAVPNPQTCAKLSQILRQTLPKIQPLSAGGLICQFSGCAFFRPSLACVHSASSVHLLCSKSPLHKMSARNKSIAQNTNKATFAICRNLNTRSSQTIPIACYIFLHTLCT